MSQRPQRYFLDPVDQSLKCKVCKEVFHDPHVIDCGHTFCYLCIALLRTAQKSCIDCHRFIEPIHMIPNINLSIIIGEFKTKCAFAGCNWTGPCFELKVHRRICQHRTKNNHKPIDFHSVIDLQRSEIEQQKGVDDEKIEKNFLYSYQNSEYLYPRSLQISEFQGFRSKQTAIPLSYPPPIQIGGQFKQKRILQDVLMENQGNRLNEIIKSGIDVNHSERREQFFFTSQQGYNEGSWSSLEEEVSMVEESKSIQDSNRSSNLIDRKIVEGQIVHLSELQDLYQLEKPQIKRTWRNGHAVAFQNVWQNCHSITMSSGARLVKKPSSLQIQPSQPTSLKPEQLKVSRLANQPQDPKEYESSYDSQN